MNEHRITEHPILPIPRRNALEFTWSDQTLRGYEGETIASALFANGIHVFGHHHRDGSPQGIFCANGQCSQCMVVANGQPVKACMVPLKAGMEIFPMDGLPELPHASQVPVMDAIPEIAVEVLIIGGGPAGLSAAIELGKLGIQTLLVDDKNHLGGKLVLQTHRFFGSASAVYAGRRGIDIAVKLENEVRSYPSVEIWLESTALAVFSDHKAGILRNGNRYWLVRPEVLLAATGAREKFLAFKGNTLPGVYGAGAFQTLVNRDLIRPCEKLFIIGGGNVGLIAGYHALQAGIGVVGLVEMMPECSGYQVHRDKLVRMGVPVYTSHTILSANGVEGVESVTIAKIDEHFQAIPGTERSFECDSILVAVGLDPVGEFYRKALDFGMKTYTAGDAEEIAEASAAILSGKIRGREIARCLSHTVNIPDNWKAMVDILKSKPGASVSENLPELTAGVTPIIHCSQEIPCDPCATLCSKKLIFIDQQDIRKLPVYVGGEAACMRCEKCVAGCPGLAITLVDYRKNPEFPTVSIPHEYLPQTLLAGDQAVVLDTSGNELGTLVVQKVVDINVNDRTRIVRVHAPREYAHRIAGIRIQSPSITEPLENYINPIDDDTIICRCERVTASEIRELIRRGHRDINEIKALSRAAMGACGSKTCLSLINRLFREGGVPLTEVVEASKRPLFVEAPLGILAGERIEAA